MYVTLMNMGHLVSLHIYQTLYVILFFTHLGLHATLKLSAVKKKKERERKNKLYIYSS